VKQFEYQFFHWQHDEPIGGAQTKWLNSLGVEGWEIVSISFGYNKDYTTMYGNAIAKREVIR
jgi:hypothetical protein